MKNVLLSQAYRTSGPSPTDEEGTNGSSRPHKSQRKSIQKYSQV